VEPDLCKRHYFINHYRNKHSTLFADSQVIIAYSEDDLQGGVFTFQNIAKKFGLEMSPEKSTAVAFLGQAAVRCKSLWITSMYND
jgi:hypothetical protein